MLPPGRALPEALAEGGVDKAQPGAGQLQAVQLVAPAQVQLQQGGCAHGHPLFCAVAAYWPLQAAMILGAVLWRWRATACAQGASQRPVPTTSALGPGRAPPGPYLLHRVALDGDAAQAGAGAQAHAAHAPALQRHRLQVGALLQGQL